MCIQKNMAVLYGEEMHYSFFVSNNFPLQLYLLVASIILDSSLAYSFAFLNIDMKQIICINAKTT